MLPLNRSNLLRIAIVGIALLPVPAGHARAGEPLVTLLETRGASLVQQASTQVQGGSEAYTRFVELVASELAASGERERAGKLRAGYANPRSPEFSRSDAAWITHTFAREYYRADIIRKTGELMRFKTFASGVPNRQNPEFIRQKEYLRALADTLGLKFRDVDGFVQEIWIGEGSKSFGLMSHSDVQPVAAEEWSNDPWSGEIIDGKIWGRGSVDDKGPIVAIMYGMRAILDSGLPLNRKVILLVGTDEESANEDISTYLKTNAAPDETIVVDSNYPVICAEKGWCGIWLHIPKDAGSMAGSAAGSAAGPGLSIVALQSGFSPSIVPEKATARLVHSGRTPSGSPLSSSMAMDEIALKAAAFNKRRRGAGIEAALAGDTIVITARGKSVHAAAPETGHNALMDLLVFLDQDLNRDREHGLLVQPNAYGLMAKFAAKYIGFELDGTSLGIAHRDSFMGGVSVAANMFQETDTTVMFMFNFRVPRGIAREKIERELNSRFAQFGAAHGFTFSDTRYLSEAHYLDPQSPLVQELLGIYNAITKENRQAESIGGGTYARRIPNAVVFGPALPDEEYRGHRPDEYFAVTTLVRNIEILTHTMVEFGMK